METLLSYTKPVISVQNVPILVSVLSSGSILIGYYVGLSNGTVTKFPGTDITHTTIHYPEYFFARIGFPTALIIMVFTWQLIIYYLNKYAYIVNQKKQMLRLVNVEGKSVAVSANLQHHFEKIKIPEEDLMNDSDLITVPACSIFYIGLAACFLFSMSICVITEHNMDWIMHSVGAVGFFILFYVNVLLITQIYVKIWKYYPNFTNEKSYKIKKYIMYPGLAIILVLIITSSFGPYKKYYPKDWGNYEEVGFVLIIVIYIATFYWDFQSFKLTFTESFQENQYQYYKPSSLIEQGQQNMIYMEL